MPRASSRRSFAAVLPLAAALSSVALSGCATLPAVRAAEAGQFEGLRASLAADVAAGRLSLGDAVSFARAVASGEIARAKGVEGAQRIKSFTSCAREVDSALDDRSDTHDDLGAVAAMVRVDAGITSPGRFSRWARTAPTAPEAAWRALGARSLTSDDDGKLRRKMIADPDEEVRRAALRAAFEADDPDDVEAVIEAARVDPSPAARAAAIRAAGGIGGERAVLALKDIWARADDTVRAQIVDAWATNRAFKSGGRRELVWVMDNHHGAPALAAALVLAGAGGEGSVEAQGVLERLVKEGSTAARVHAIEAAPLSFPGIRAAVLKAESDHDDAVAVAAMVRRFEAPRDLGGPADAKAREDLAARLLKSADAGSVAARGALARAHDVRLRPMLERDGAAKEGKLRAQAGTALAVLGDLRLAAVVAADPEPAVRATVSCAILRAWAAK